MIFITLGSQKFPFDRLLMEADKLIEKKEIREEVFAQTGFSDYHPMHYRSCQFLDREEFADWQRKADIVLTHGGTGAIVGALKAGKKVIAVPRLSAYGEHVDDHQLQIIRQFGQMDLIEPCLDVEQLGEKLRLAGRKEYAPYHSNTEEFVSSIQEYIENSIVRRD